MCEIWAGDYEVADVWSETIVRFEMELRECFGSESRPAWTDEDRRWRVLLAGMIRRRRAAERVPA